MLTDLQQWAQRSQAITGPDGLPFGNQLAGHIGQFLGMERFDQQTTGAEAHSIGNLLDRSSATDDQNGHTDVT